MSTPFRQRYLAPAILIGLTALAYANTLRVPFLFDDVRAIRDSLQVRSVAAAVSPDDGYLFAPRGVGTFSFALNYAVHGLRLEGYHVANLAIHIVAGLALFGFVRRTLRLPYFGDRFDDTADAHAFAIALLWLVHPLQTQAVTYVTQRYESLAGMGCWLTFYCYSRTRGDFRGQRGWMVASFVCGALAIASKETMVALLPLIVWYDRVFFAKSWNELASRGWYFVLLETITLVYYGHMARAALLGVARQCIPGLASLGLEKIAAAETAETSVIQVHGLTPLTYLYSQASVILHYLRLTFFPFGQCFDSDWPVVRTLAAAALPGSVIVAMLLLTFVAIRKWPAWSFVGAWFFLILAPTSSIVPIMDVAVEHRMYLPIAAPMALVVFGLGALLTAAKLSNATQSRVLSAGALCVAIALTGITFARNNVYATVLDLWTDVSQKAPHNPRGPFNVGQELALMGKSREACKQFRRTIELGPTSHEGYAALADELAKLGDDADAEANYHAALKIAPGNASLLKNHVTFLLSRQREAETIVSIIRLLKVGTPTTEEYIDYGEILSRHNEPAVACEAFALAVKSDPRNARALVGVAETALAQGKLEAAMHYAERAARVAPSAENEKLLRQVQQRFDAANGRSTQSIR